MNLLVLDDDPHTPRLKTQALKGGGHTAISCDFDRRGAGELDGAGCIVEPIPRETLRRSIAETLAEEDTVTYNRHY